MKKFFLISTMALILNSWNINAQMPPIHYTADYPTPANNYSAPYGEMPDPYTPSTPRYSPQKSVHTYRAIAYCESNGEYKKLPIQVSETTIEYSSGVDRYLEIVAYYTNYGAGGNWVSCNYRVEECSHGYWVKNQLELSFMYKAMIGYNWMYFDL